MELLTGVEQTIVIKKKKNRFNFFSNYDHSGIFDDELEVIPFTSTFILEKKIFLK